MSLASGPSARWTPMALSAAMVARAAGDLLLVVGAVVFLRKVEVIAACSPARADPRGRRVGTGGLAAGRRIPDPAPHIDLLPVRMARCPEQENRRFVGSGALAANATVIVAAGAVVTRRRALQTRAQVPPEARRFHHLGHAITLLGVALSVCGAGGPALLVRDPSSPLFASPRLDGHGHIGESPCPRRRLSQNTIGTVGQRTCSSARPSATMAGRTRSRLKMAE